MFLFNLREIFRPVVYFLFNILTMSINLFIHRDRSIILMGAWYGERFGGNSRFLFQYLSENKRRFGLKKVIWVTRNKKILGELKKLGYEVYMMKSVKGIYYHFKAGIHVISTNITTSDATNKRVTGDIMGQLSLGAVRVYLNHGVTSIKGNRIRDYERLKGIEKVVVALYKLFHKNFFLRNYVLCPGGWDRMIYLSPGSESIKRDLSKQLESDHKIIWEEGYPELCKCMRFLKDEQTVVNKIKKHDKTIFYLPTYRTNDQTGYLHPLNNKKLCKYLEENHLFWIDKLHPGAKENMNATYYDPKISLKLTSDFDTNVLLREVDVVITDYSGVCYSAVYFDKPIIYYWPDHEKYLEKDKGIMEEFKNDIAGYITYCPEELMKVLEKCFEKEYMAKWQEKYRQIKKDFFDDRVVDYENITRSLFDLIQKKW